MRFVHCWGFFLTPPITEESSHGGEFVATLKPDHASPGHYIPTQQLIRGWGGTTQASPHPKKANICASSGRKFC